jgi:CheY-like chemotaxis protein
MSWLALVVDDSMLVRHILRRFLEQQGFTVETASDGVEAVKALETARPNVIFTDLQMPRMDGHEFIEVLNGKPELSAVPVVVLAARPLPGAPPTPHTRFVISKDLNIETQLEQLLQELVSLLQRQRNASDASAENSAEANSRTNHLG